MFLSPILATCVKSVQCICARIPVVQRKLNHGLPVHTAFGYSPTASSALLYDQLKSVMTAAASAHLLELAASRNKEDRVNM